VLELCMQMVRVYCEKSASYEYVKWKTKHKKRERERNEWNEGQRREWNEKRSVRGKAEIATEVSRNDATST